MSDFFRLKPGDVIAVNTGNSFAAFMIRLGAALANKPNLDNHVAVMVGTGNGKFLGIEGRPGGVGTVDLSRYNNSYLVSNVDQPKTDAQRAAIVELANKLVGVPYDWEAIGVDAIRDIEALFGGRWDWMLSSRRFGSQMPMQVMCGSALAWVYDKIGLSEPSKSFAEDRWVQPCDWVDWMLKRGWQ